MSISLSQLSAVGRAERVESARAESARAESARAESLSESGRLSESFADGDSLSAMSTMRSFPPPRTMSREEICAKATYDALPNPTPPYPTLPRPTPPYPTLTIPFISLFPSPPMPTLPIYSPAIANPPLCV